MCAFWHQFQVTANASHQRPSFTGTDCMRLLGDTLGLAIFIYQTQHKVLLRVFLLPRKSLCVNTRENRRF